MRQIWGPVWFATALCAITLVAMLFGPFETAAPAFLCFLPVVFLQMARNLHTLSKRLESLERAPRGTPLTRSGPEG